MQELADRTGYKRPSLSNIECEIKPRIPRTSLERIATALAVDPAVLVRDPVTVAASGHQMAEKGAA